jgi:hypothetical protein
VPFNEDSDASWHRYRPQPKECLICGKPFTVTGRSTAKTCPSLDCKKEYKRRYERGYYKDNSVKIIARTSASRRRRHKPIFKQCKAPHPTIPGALCGKEFEVKTTGDGRRLTCTQECSVRRRWALQRDRYHADPQAKQGYKNAYYAANYAHELVTKWCPYCGREFETKRHNQQTCGRPYCIQRIYETTAREEINARKRKKRRGNPVYAVYQRKYRIANPEKFKGYRAKKRLKTALA